MATHSYINRFHLSTFYCNGIRFCHTKGIYDLWWFRRKRFAVRRFEKRWTNNDIASDLTSGLWWRHCNISNTRSKSTAYILWCKLITECLWPDREGCSSLPPTVPAHLIGTETYGVDDVVPPGDDPWFCSDIYTNCTFIYNLYLDVGRDGLRWPFR